jgi:peptidoglycan/LPS O-acetylase OafA/YrhL
MPSVPTPTPDQPGPAPASETSRIVGIDGLRALAVLGVMVFHADWVHAQGGFFGVDLFFVISGFLITRLLLAELERSGTISFRGFYLRRARRILPAMFLVIAGAALAAVVLAPDALRLLRVDALASALFVVNWHFIFQQLSYFEYIGRQPLLQHLWSLAIEEQFYLLWPLIVLALASRGGRRLLGLVAVALAAASAVWMGVLAERLGFPESMDIGRVYFGTDTHAMGLLAGAALAAAAPGISAWAHASVDEAGGLRRTGTLLGIAGLAGTLFLFSQVSENHPWLYPWAFVASALFSMAAIVACLMPGPFGALLDAQPLRWIGERSYGIYLWHWPVFMLTRPGVDIPLEQGPAFALRCALTFALAAASYRFIEAPILGRSLRPMPVTPQFARGALAALACAALFILVPPPGGVPTGAKAAAQGAAGALAGGAPGAAPVAGAAATSPPTAASPGTVATTTDRAPPSLIGRRSGQLTVVGDSVALGARSAIERGIDGAAVYAMVGWQAADVLSMLQRIRDAGELRSKVLIHLGTNGYVTEKQLRAMLELLRDRERVMVMNSRVPRRWMAANNRLLATVVPQYPNAVLIDWHGISDPKPEFFVQDGVHLTGAGMRAFVAAVVAAGDFSKASPPDAAPDEPRQLLSPIMPEATEPEDYAPSLVRHTRPMAPDSFWQTMARCETGNNWQNGGEYAGGLGIYVGTWRQWGGREFAPTPDAATPAQQIVIANRVSTQGWQRPDGRFEPPVGFSGWGCLKTIGRPTLMMFTPESLLAQRFRWLQRGQAVRDLQLLLGLPVDGVYRDRTAVRHREILEQRGLPISLAASAPASSPSTAAASGVATTAPMAPTPDAAGVPAKTGGDGSTAAAVAAESPTTPAGTAPAAETPAAGPAEPAATAPSGEPAPAAEPPPEGAR